MKTILLFLMIPYISFGQNRFEKIVKQADSAFWTTHKNPVKKDVAKMNIYINQLKSISMETKWEYGGYPIVYETGVWDGKRSCEVVAVDDIDIKHIARVFVGTIDGSEFIDWVDNDGYIIDREIVKWIELPE